MGQGRIIRPPVIDRGRRCQNCRHFEHGELALQHYKAKRFADLQQVAAEVLTTGRPRPQGRLGDDDADTLDFARRARQSGVKAALADIKRTPSRHTSGDFSDLDSAMQALGVNYDLGDRMMRQGVLGMCRVGASEADFVHMAFLCGTKYEPRVKVDDAQKHDETGDEARDRMGFND